MNPKDNPPTFENPYFSSSKKPAEISLQPRQATIGLPRTNEAPIYTRNTTTVSGYAGGYQQGTVSYAPAAVGFRGSSNQNVVSASGNQPAADIRFSSNQKRVNNQAGETVAYQNSGRNVSYREKENIEEAERPQYKKIYTNDNPQVGGKSRSAKVEDEGCPVAIPVLLGLLGLAGITLGVLFGLGVIGGLNGPLAHPGAVGGSGNNDAPSTPQQPKPDSTVSPNTDAAIKTDGNAGGATPASTEVTPIQWGPKDSSNFTAKSLNAESVVYAHPNTTADNASTVVNTPTATPPKNETSTTTTVTPITAEKIPPSSTTTTTTTTTNNNNQSISTVSPSKPTVTVNTTTPSGTTTSPTTSPTTSTSTVTNIPVTISPKNTSTDTNTNTSPITTNTTTNKTPTTTTTTTPITTTTTTPTTTTITPTTITPTISTTTVIINTTSPTTTSPTTNTSTITTNTNTNTTTTTTSTKTPTTTTTITPATTATTTSPTTNQTASSTGLNLITAIVWGPKDSSGFNASNLTAQNVTYNSTSVSAPTNTTVVTTVQTIVLADQTPKSNTTTTPTSSATNTTTSTSFVFPPSTAEPLLHSTVAVGNAPSTLNNHLASA